MKLTKVGAPTSLSRVGSPVQSRIITVGLVQMSWLSDPAQHQANLALGIQTAAAAGAQVVFLPELTLSRYPADALPTFPANSTAEDLQSGPTHVFAASQAAKHNVYVHASLFQKQDRTDGRGLNVAIVVAPSGEIVAATPKLHIPVTAGYYEDQYFAPGPNQNPYPVHNVNLSQTQLALGLPTCWDEWFPEVARAYSLAGAEVLCYPTAIGSEPDHPSFDTQPLWQQVIVGNGIANGTFMVVPNRHGNEGALTFYGSSFISDPYGRVLAQASRNTDEVLVADLDLNQRADWLNLFPFLATRRPDTYESLTQPVVNPRSENGLGLNGGIAGVAQSPASQSQTQADRN